MNNEEPNEIRDAIRAAIRAAALESRVRECDAPSAEQVLARIRSELVEDSQATWWWDSLKGTTTGIPFPDGDAYQYLGAHVPPGEGRCWFVADLDEDDAFAVFDAEIDALAAIVGECSYFEYYLVGKAFDWVLAENHHNQLVVARLETGARESD